MDNRDYNNQQQISHPSNQFGVPFSMNGKCNSGYYDSQQHGLSDYSGSKFGSLPIRSNSGYYGGPQVTPVSYYSPRNSDSVNANHGYYGREQQAFDHGGYKHIEPANFLNINGSYCGAQEQSGSNYRQPFEMQNYFNRYAVVERLAADGMMDRSNGEFNSSHRSGNTNSMKRHSGAIPSEQQVPVEQLYITHQVGDSNSAPIKDYYRPMDRDIALINGLGRLNTNIAPTSGPSHSSDPSFAFANNFDHPQNSSSSLVSGPIYSQITNSVPILSLGDFQDRISAAVGPSHSVNGNCKSINGFHNLWDNNSALVVNPGCLMNTNPASIPGPGTVVNTSFTGLENNNSALTNGHFQPEHSNPALDGGSGRLANNKGILVSGLGHPQDSGPGFTSSFTPANSNGALIKFPRLGPRPPRWCNETIKTTTPILSPPLTPLKELILRKYEDEENDLKNPLSSPSLESLLRGSTSFENLARVDSISRTDISLAYIPHCPHIMKGRCQDMSKLDKWCSDKIHFKRIVYAHTDVRLGDCSFLDSCDMMDKCPYIHYVPELPEIANGHFGKLAKEVGNVLGEEKTGARRLADEVGPVSAKDKVKPTFPNIQRPPNTSPPPQWIRCDVRQLDLKILGKFGAVMADPPWDIRMTLPYGTVPDQAIIDLPFKDLQDEGVFFLWCTARAVDTGRACLKAWGYRFSDEIAWVKADHLRRLISVGRTGHWLNHTMEHCLVGIKGDPEWIRKGCDTDVIVSQPRATSHKPDEIYELIERLVGPHTRKLEIFGREHNIRKGWLTLGNQLSSTYLHEKNLKEALVKELAHNSNTRCYYSPDWDPWSGGFTRYGYGEKSDWREERRLCVNRANSRGRSSREIRGGGNGDSGGDATTVDVYARKEKEGETMVEWTEEI